MSTRPPDEPPFLKRLLEEVSKQLEQHPLHDDVAQQELLDGLSRSLGGLSTSGKPELMVIEGGPQADDGPADIGIASLDEQNSTSEALVGAPDLQLLSSPESEEKTQIDGAMLNSLGSFLSGAFNDSEIHVEVLSWPSEVGPDAAGALDESSEELTEAELQQPGQIILTNHGQRQQLLLTVRPRLLRVHCSQGELSLELSHPQGPETGMNCVLKQGQSVDVEGSRILAIAFAKDTRGWYRHVSHLNDAPENLDSEIE